MTTPNLQRVTTEYVMFEDRIRLSGEVGSTAPVVVWLTLRLLQRLLPAMLRWLAEQAPDTPRPEVMQEFAQQAARAELAPQAPVRAAAESAAWIAQSVDLGRSGEMLSLIFRGADGQSAALVLAAKPLRQWLNILYDGYCKAEWPLDVWPGWLRESVSPAKQPAGMLH